MRITGKREVCYVCTPMTHLGLFLVLVFGVWSSVVGQSTTTQNQRPKSKLIPHHIALANGKSFDLNLPDGYEISIAAQGLKRVRFMTMSPDKRLFVTDMFNLTDNRRGVVYILDQFDPATRQFKKVTKFLSGLRNPNSVAFYTDRNGTSWFYVALTDRLVRYRYEEGKDAPSGTPEVLATFPDYGLGYKYGGWHLTRTVIVGGNEKIYIAVGSSCNACEEKEEVRATIVEMDPDGKNQRYSRAGCAMRSGCVGPTASSTRPTWVQITSARIVPQTRFTRLKAARITVGPTAFNQARGSIPMASTISMASLTVARCQRH